MADTTADGRSLLWTVKAAHQMLAGEAARLIAGQTVNHLCCNSCHEALQSYSRLQHCI